MEKKVCKKDLPNITDDAVVEFVANNIARVTDSMQISIERGLSLTIANLMVEIAKISHSWQHWMPGMPYQKLRNATSQNISRLELPPSIHYYTNPGGYK